MSSWKNAIRRREHRERPQPAVRAKFGMLEKHQDYKKRATNFHAKEKRMTALKQRAAFKNPDEFYFKMVKTGVKDGKHVLDNSAEQLSSDTIKVLKSQDLTYVQLRAQAERKKVEKMQSTLHGTDEGGQGNHVFFVDDVESYSKSRAAKRAAVEPEAPEVQAAMKALDPKLRSEAPVQDTRRAVKRQAKAYAELEARKERLQKLRNAEAHLQTTKQLISKGKRKQLKPAEDGQPAVYKWRTERKR